MRLSKVFTAYFKKHWLLTGIGVIIIALDIAFTLLPPFLMRKIVDEIIPNSDLAVLLTYSIFYMLSYTLLGVSEFLKKLILISLSQGICTEIRKNLLKKVNVMPYEELSKYDTGTLESYFNNDVNTINTLVSDGIISMCIDMVKMIGVLISLFAFKVSIGWLVLALMPFLFGFILFVRKKMYKAMLKTKEMEASVNQQTLETVDNLEAIQTYASYEYTENQFEKTLIEHFKARNVSMFYGALFPPVMIFTRYVLVMSIMMVSYNYPSVFSISVGSFLAISDLIVDLFSPMENIGNELQTLQNSQASIHRISLFLKTPNDMKKDQTAKEEKPVLRYENISYSYAAADGKVISDFSLTLNPGDKLTLKGASGVGKSTLFKLGYGLLKPQEGKVTVNGIETYELTEESRQKLFGIVYQDSFFSQGTIKEEICLGEASSFSDEDVFNVLNQVGLNRIKDINVPLNVKDYSSGELSLFNIARVLLKKTPIIFLDEMNAKIDPQTAKNIIELLNKYAQESTILSITHYGTQLIGSKELTLTAKEKL